MRLTCESHLVQLFNKLRLPTASVIQLGIREAANILRGSAVDRTDWKGYILPLLFFKRICDVWDEENSEATDTYGDAYSSQFPEVHRFQVPEGCHWRDIRETAVNVGTALAHAMQEIERANPRTPPIGSPIVGN